MACRCSARASMCQLSISGMAGSTMFHDGRMKAAKSPRNCSARSRFCLRLRSAIRVSRRLRSSGDNRSRTEELCDFGVELLIGHGRDSVVMFDRPVILAGDLRLLSLAEALLAEPDQHRSVAPHGEF